MLRTAISSKSMSALSKEEATMVDAVDEHRDDLEDLADSDLSCSWIAEALLETTDTGV